MKPPYLDFESWTDTRITLHLIMQIIGKIRLAETPRKNHWWYVTLYVSARGFSTHPIPLGDGLNVFEINVDILRKAVLLESSDGKSKEIPLRAGLTVADFYRAIMGTLKDWGVRPEFVDRPFDVGVEEPFDKIAKYHHYDWNAIEKFWQMMLWNDSVLKEFSGRFYGKTCPVHIYWHHMDLTVTRFSGKRAPAVKKNASAVEKDAYSHEVISSGFWAGDENTREPAYYSYTFPAPSGLDKEPLPPGAFWIEANGSPMAILKYRDVVESADPRKAALDFLEASYQAGAKLAHWDAKEMEVPSLEAL